MQKRVALVTLLLLGSWTAGCGDNVGPPNKKAPPSGPCSELARAIYHWQGTEQEVCGLVNHDQRELMAIGQGFVLEWLPASGRHNIWKVQDLTLGVAAKVLGGVTASKGHVLYPLGDLHVLDAEPLTNAWTIYAVDAFTNINGIDELHPNLGTDTWLPESLFWGNEILALDDDYVMKWRPGSGHYDIFHHEFRSANSGMESLKPTSFTGQQAAFRRGARLVNLGAHRLLEWIPFTKKYRIWSYRFDPGTPEIFQPEPGDYRTWDDLGPRHEIMVVRDDTPPSKLLVWDRDTGTVALNVLDPTAADPRQAPTVTTLYPHLQSFDFKPETESRIENVVLFLQRGRSFDSYFGQYCRGQIGAPQCSEGPACCERMPDSIAGADHCTPIDVSVRATYVPDNGARCLESKINGGAMDGYVSGCGTPADFACAGVGEAAGAVDRYHKLAASGALADHFFQTTISGDDRNAELNAIYLSKAASGTSVEDEGSLNQLTFKLADKNVRYALYVNNPLDPKDVGNQIPPGFYDAHWTHYRAIDELARDIELDQLGDISLIFTPPALGEEPGAAPAEAGIDFVTDHIAQLMESPHYRSKALVLLTYLTTGGYYDHVSPPLTPPITVDSQVDFTDPQHLKIGLVPYGPRVPLLALGTFARAGHVSHETLELSSLVKFFEWNWMGGKTLGHRDSHVANIGDLLDPQMTGVESLEEQPDSGAP